MTELLNTFEKEPAKVFLKLISTELVYFKPVSTSEDVIEKSTPSAAFIICVEINGKCICFCRTTGLRSKKGKLPVISASLFELAAEQLIGMNFVESYENIDLKIRSSERFLRKKVYQKAIKARLIKKKNQDERALKNKVKRRIKLVAVLMEEISHIAQGANGNTSLDSSKLYLNGEPAGFERKNLLAEFYNKIEDYKCYPLPKKPVLDGKEINEYDDYFHLRKLKQNGTKGYLYYYYSLGFGLSTQRLSKGSLVARNDENKSMLFSWSTSQLSSIVSHSLCNNKEVTRNLLQDAGLVTPLGRSFPAGQYEAAIKYAESIGYPLVSKPLNGSKGDGVVVNIRNKEQLKSSIDALSRSVYKESDFIVEKYINGKDYRIVVVGDEVKGALCREPASVTGNGRATIIELMLAKHCWRMRNPHFVERSSFISEDATFGDIHERSLDLLAIPQEGETVVFGTSCNLSQGADSVDVLDELHSSIKLAAIKAVQAIPGLQYCGVDILLEDHTKDINAQSAGIIELNAKAAIGNCEYPVFGCKREVVRSVFESVATNFNINMPNFNDGKHIVYCEVKGGLKGKQYTRWLTSLCRDLGVGYNTKIVNNKRVLVRLEGALNCVAVVATRMIVGPSGVRPTSVNIFQGDSSRVVAREFENISDEKGSKTSGLLTKIKNRLEMPF